MKLFKKIMIFLLLSIIIVGLGIFICYKYEVAPVRFSEFLRDNTKRSSIYIIKNDTVLLEKNINRMMPLASTMKWIILISYCEKSSKKEIDDNLLINLNEISLYYTPLTDGGAHEAWMRDLTTHYKIKNNQVHLIDVARGMILFSSNACTEFLTDLLGIETVNEVLKKFEVKNHEKIFYIVSYLFTLNMLDELKIKKMSNKEMMYKTIEIHEKVKSKIISVNKLLEFSDQKLQLFSQKFTRSTTKDYVDLLKKINDPKYVSKEFINKMNQIFDPIVRKNKANFKTILLKGGSTANILTTAFFAQTINGDKYYGAYFIENMEIDESFFLKKSINNFGLNFLTRKEKQNEYIKVINDEF